MQLKKIVVLGPESTGKSTLCQQLAGHYNTTWVPEFARHYLQTNGIAYTLSDLSLIAQGQLQSEDEVIGRIEKKFPKNKPGFQPVFIDTDMYVMKVWSEFAFNACDNKILNAIANRTYHLYLLCNPDLPWQKDNLREYPDLQTREKLYHYYKDVLLNQPLPFVEIKGKYQERLHIAINAVDANMQ
ncbi:MAG: ATP-binding protein [Ferruginibacter sp.]